MLREDGFRTIVVNSNPATIMTDPGFADRTYLEPLDLEGVADVLERERPDALLPTMGGQTALNLALELAEAGVLDELGIELIGAPARRDPPRRGPRALQRGGRSVRPAACPTLADRHRRSTSSHGVCAARPSSGPAFTLGGHGGGFVADAATSSSAQVERGLRESPIGQVLVEESRARLGRVRARGRPRPRRQRRRSSARSRTSTRWASTPATRSRSRRR